MSRLTVMDWLDLGLRVHTQMCYCGIGSLIRTDHYMNHATAELSSYLTKVLLLSGGKCEDMRDFIWLLRSYLINSWIRQNLSRVATTTSARGIEHGAARLGYSPGHQTQERSVEPVRDQSEASIAWCDQSEARLGGECLHCRGSAEPAPTHPCQPELHPSPVNTCQKQLARTQTEFAALNWITPTTFTKYDEKENVQSFPDKIIPFRWLYSSISRQSILISISFSHQLDTRDW